MAKKQHLVIYKKSIQDLCAGISGSLISWFTAKECCPVYMGMMGQNIISSLYHLSLGPKLRNCSIMNMVFRLYIRISVRVVSLEHSTSGCH